MATGTGKTAEVHVVGVEIVNSMILGTDLP